MAEINYDLKVELRAIDSLVPYENNARTHTGAQVSEIVASIKKFGWTNPILVDEDSGILAGHGRLEAAKELGLKQVPVIELSGLSEVQRRAYILADNRIPLNAAWDIDLLKVELEGLAEEGFDLSLLGFNTQELDGMLGPEEDPPEEDGGEKDVNFTIQYNIIFDDEEQQADWYSFVKYLKSEFPEAETLGLRLQLFMRKHGYVTD